MSIPYSTPRRRGLPSNDSLLAAGFLNTDRRPRALLYSHDTFGLGHIRRNLVIAEHLLSRQSSFDVMLLSGSPVAGSWPMPPGLQLRVMPPVVKIGEEAYASRDGSMTFAEVKARRERVILDAILDFRPDVVLVDHAPAGMKGELLRALSFLRTAMPATKTVLGLRDILDDGATVCDLWQKEGVYDLIRNSYDRVLVYGSPSFFDVVGQYRLPAWISAKLRYCGHVARTRPTAPEHGASPRPRGGKTVLVTVGGGGDGYELIDAYLQALESLSILPERSMIVSGPLMPGDQQDRLDAAVSRHRNVVLTHSTTEMPKLLAEADLAVTMAGYNSTAEILAARKPAILVPRAAPRAEQRLRATLLANKGLVWAVLPEDHTVSALAGFLKAALSGAEPPALRSEVFDLNGAQRVGDALEALIELEHAATSYE